ncbi:MAG: pentapeptide repeat-containing protein [Burkholderiales bacterium]|nr:pentapeptide repeat-containing protein [Burkholderiales bacterium]
MRLPDVLVEEERVRQWWSAWRVDDFSWNGLAARPMPPNDDGIGSLRDYWLTDPVTGAVRDTGTLTQSGEVIADPAGMLWHLAHVPVRWDDGTPTWKAERSHPHWARFWDIIAKHLAAANPTDDDDDLLTTVPLDGVVFGEPPRGWLWHAQSARLNARFVRCAFLGRVSFGGVRTETDLGLDRCLFRMPTSFDNVTVDGRLDIRRCEFLAQLTISGARIEHDMLFEDSHVGGELALLGSRIGGELRLWSNVLHAVALFDGATFASEARIAWNRFLNITSFDRVRFRGGVDLQQNHYADDVTFSGRSYGEFRCVDCRFEQDVTLAFLCFHRDAWFARCRFEGYAQFQAVRFGKRASFVDSTFAVNLRCDRVRFRGETGFETVVFGGYANFTGCDFPRDARHYHGAFRGADFRRNADFTIDGFHAWGAFIDATFQQRLLLSGKALQDDAGFEQAFAAAEQAANMDALGVRSDLPAALDRRFGELVGAFQALKQAMARQQARLDEHRFYRLELLARLRMSSTSSVERGIIRIYDCASRCGTSFVRPLAVLGLLVLLFALGYWAASLPAGELRAAMNPYPPRPVDARLVDAVRFSVENTIQPMSVWSKRFTEPDPREAWVRGLLSPHGPAGYLAVRVVATLQSLVSIALLFLVVLGFKRHFQMNT